MSAAEPAPRVLPTTRAAVALGWVLVFGARVGLDPVQRLDATAWTLALLPLLYVAHMVLHELGHAVFGALAGFTVTEVRAGPLRWRTGQGLGWNRAALAGVTGVTRAVPPAGPGLRRRVLAYLAGGPLTSAGTGLLALLLGAGVPAAWAPPLLGFGFLGLLVGGAALLLLGQRMGDRVLPSDGQQLLGVLLRWEQVRSRWAPPMAGDPPPR